MLLHFARQLRCFLPSRLPALQLVKDIQDALDYLDTHYTFTKEQVSGIVASAMGRQLSRLDSSLLDVAAVDPTKQPVRPC